MFSPVHSPKSNVLGPPIVNYLAVKYSVILPTYNEHENIALIVSMLIHSFDAMEDCEYEIVIVDDSSPDHTFDDALQLQKLYGSSKIIAVKRQGKLGLGSAYKFGLRYCSGTMIFLLDADMSHHPKYIPLFIEKQKEGQFDVVTGTR